MPSPRQQLGQLPRVPHAIVAVAVVHQHVHPVRLFGQAADGCDPALQFLLRVQVAEALGSAEVRPLVGFGVLAVEALVIKFHILVNRAAGKGRDGFY